MKKWQLLATLIETLPWRERNAVNHVRLSTDNERILCTCTTRTILFTPEPPTPAENVCKHIQALYRENRDTSVTVNFTELGREVFHSIYAARALER